MSIKCEHYVKKPMWVVNNSLGVYDEQLYHSRNRREHIRIIYIKEEDTDIRKIKLK